MFEHETKDWKILDGYSARLAMAANFRDWAKMDSTRYWSLSIASFALKERLTSVKL